MQSNNGSARLGDTPGDVLLVDPSLFTAPYDARLSEGLEVHGINSIWATRRLRSNEEDDLGEKRVVCRFFYPNSDGLQRRDGSGARWLKGAEHLLGLARLVAMVRRLRPAVVHVQWGLVPFADRLAIRMMRGTSPVVVTVHDLQPFNGKAVSTLQRSGHDKMLAAADHLIVHTTTARSFLADKGFDEACISVVPHGLLEVRAPAATTKRDPRWTIVLFGKIQAYKGVDVLVEALGLLSDQNRSRLRVVVAGEPMIDLNDLHTRAAALGLDGVLEWRPHYHSEAEVGALLAEADAYVFPYRAIEASGAFMLVVAAGKWIIASNLGAFSEIIGDDGQNGTLIPPGDIAALAGALAASINERPKRDPAESIPSWAEIGRRTIDVYRVAADHWRTERGLAVS